MATASSPATTRYITGPRLRITYCVPSPSPDSPPAAEKQEPAPQRLGTRWEKSTLRFARIVTAISLVPVALIAAALAPSHLSPWTTLPLAPVAALGVYAALTRGVHRRRAILAQPFPPEWEAVLQREVVFFRALEPSERVRFRRQLQIFLGEKRITGIGTPLDTTTRVLAGASAIIPIFRC